MLKIPSRTPRSRRVWLACLLACAASCSDDTGTFTNYHPAVKLMIFSDPHYFDPSLGTVGAAFDAYLANDRKLIAESDAQGNVAREYVYLNDTPVAVFQ